MRKPIVTGGSIALFVLGPILFMTGALAQDSVGERGRRSGKPNPLNNLYFGQQHLHTVNSPDAFAFGIRNTPDDAYRYYSLYRI